VVAGIGFEPMTSRL